MHDGWLIADSEKSPYHLDVLDCLQDLQREGLIRSIASNKLTPELLRSAVKCGFSIDSHQIDCNLIEASGYCSSDTQLLCQDLGIPLFLSGPLAGGLLTERHMNTKFEPLSFELTRSERRFVKSLLPKWAAIHAGSKGQVWDTFQRNMMAILADIALKHRVSVSAVALRWALQLDYVSSVVPSCTLMRDPTDDRPFVRPKEMRQVFQLELDGEDMERLWEAAGQRPAVGDDLNLFGSSSNSDADSFLPDLSNTKLWL
jgi:aryl-alcohol dehydrogenase-like predicted oxidoreductase